MIAVWESDISAIFLIICLKLLTDTAFFRHKQSDAERKDFEDNLGQVHS